MNRPSSIASVTSATIYDQLRDDILSCRLLPGVPMFEPQLAVRFGTSKSPVREALLRLRNQGLVEVKARSGYRVTPMSVAQVDDMFEMRIMYETTCVALAVANATDAAIARLDGLRLPSGCKDPNAWPALNRRFHMELASLCGNTRLALTAAEFVARFTRFVHLGALRLRPPVRRQRADHAAIVAAIRRRDGDRAQSILADHIEVARRRALDALSRPPFTSEPDGEP